MIVSEVLLVIVTEGRVAIEIEGWSAFVTGVWLLIVTLKAAALVQGEGLSPMCSAMPLCKAVSSKLKADVLTVLISRTVMILLPFIPPPIHERWIWLQRHTICVMMQW